MIDTTHFSPRLEDIAEGINDVLRELSRISKSAEVASSASANSAMAEIAAEIEQCIANHKESECDKIQLSTLQRWAQRLRQ